MFRTALPVLLVCAAVSSAQSTVTLPDTFDRYPGNVGLSLPLRWQIGTLQVVYGSQALPAALQGKTITGVTLRRPAFLGEPAYGGVNRTLRVVLAMTNMVPNQMTQNLKVSFTTGPSGNPILTEVLAPTPFSVAGSSPHGPSDVLAADLIHLPFTTPFTMGTGNLLLQIEVHGQTLGAAPDNWVDGVWFPGGADTGFAVAFGNGGCASGGSGTPTLAWAGSGAPDWGKTARFTLEGAEPSTAVALLVTALPDKGRRGGGYRGPGQSLGFLPPPCVFWCSMNTRSTWSTVVTGTTNGLGSATLTVPLPAVGGLNGAELVAQAFQVAGNWTVASNGVAMVVGAAGLGPHQATAFSTNLPPPGQPAPWAEWPPYQGLAPVVRFDVQ